MLLGLIVQSIGVTLLLRHPTLPYENGVAAPSDPGQLTVCLDLPARRLGLRQIRFGLGDLMVELRGGDRRQEIARLHARADIDIAFRDVPACSRENVRGLERVGG